LDKKIDKEMERQTDKDTGDRQTDKDMKRVRQTKWLEAYRH
jgi:hypothetical protein